MGLDRKWSLAYVESKVGRAADGFSSGGGAGEDAQQRNQSSREELAKQRHDAGRRPAETAKTARKCNTRLGRDWGIDDTREIGKKLRVIGQY